MRTANRNGRARARVAFNPARTALGFALVLAPLACVAVSAPAQVATAPAPGATGTKLVKGLEGLTFKITTETPETQAWFNQGLMLLYGFNHGEAIRSFTEAAALDPDAAMPWWGIAYANGMHINNPVMSEQQWKDSHEAAQRALEELDNESDLERELVEAVATRTAWPVPPEQRLYDEAFAAAMEEVYKQNRDNPDVAVLYTESLMNLQPWDYWTEDLKPKGRCAEMVGVLEHALEVAPAHPQVAHLYIHAMEASSEPAKAEAAADRLTARHLAAGHLVHMPSHIYARLGRYSDAVTANEAAVAADDAFFKLGTDPGFYYVYHAHNLHFLAFASMMEGRYGPAIAAAQRLEKAVPDPVLDKYAGVIEGIIPTTYHVMIRFGKWDDILRKDPPPENRPLMLAVHHYARGIALAATGRAEEARAELAAYDAQVEKVPQDWWIFSNKAHDVLPIGHQMLAGELAYREGRLDDAWAALRKGIDAEDALKYDEPPGWMIPVRHSMGALLLEAGKPDEAERLYREDQARHPGNGWSLLGLKQALETQGREDELPIVTAKLDQAWKRVEDRPSSSCLCAPRASQ